MTVKTGQVWTGLWAAVDSTGALSTPSVGPAGVLYVNGVASAATVAISGSNPYKWSVTLPTIAAGQSVSMYITATVALVATAQVVREDICDTYRISDLASATLSVTSPVSTSGNVTTYQGDDYDSADGRQLSWTVSTTATLTGGTVAVILASVATYTGAIASETSVTLDLTATQTAAIPVGRYKYQVVATQAAGSGSDVITLVEGTWTSAARVSS